MSRSHDPFSAVLASLHERLEQGVYPAGRPIVIIEEARRLKLSTTPVREALAWLCGEGLVQRAPTGGYLAPRLEPAVVRDRFALRSMCLSAGLDVIAAVPNGPAAAAASRTQGELQERFVWVIKAAGNLALEDAFARVQRQLVRLRRVEGEVFSDIDRETQALHEAFSAGELRRIREAIMVYHERRMAAAPLLLAAAVRREADPADGPDSI